MGSNNTDDFKCNNPCRRFRNLGRIFERRRREVSRLGCSLLCIGNLYDSLRLGEQPFRLSNAVLSPAFVKLYIALDFLFILSIFLSHFLGHFSIYLTGFYDGIRIIKCICSSHGFVL